MSSFKIDIQNVEREATNMDSICKDIKQIGSSIKNISNSLSISGVGAEAIKAKLLAMQDEIIADAVKVNTLQGALKEVAAGYLRTENKIAGSAVEWSNAVVEASAAAVNSIYERLKKKVKEIIAKIKNIINPPKVSKTQEQEHDRYMKSQISKLQDKYSAKWGSASAKEREKLLKEYMKEVSAIMGISVNLEKWSAQPSSNGYITLGYYSSSSNGVWVNTEAIKNYDADTMLSTITHELRHAYQHQAIKNPSKFKVSPETIKSWKDSFSNYMSTDGFMRKYGVSRSEAFKMYQNQSVEVDARAFAGE